MGALKSRRMMGRDNFLRYDGFFLLPSYGSLYS